MKKKMFTFNTKTLVGTALGAALFTVNGREVGRVALLCGRSVPRRLESAMVILKLGVW